MGKSKVELFIKGKTVYFYHGESEKEFELTFKNNDEATKFIESFKNVLKYVQENGYSEEGDVLILPYHHSRRAVKMIFDVAIPKKERHIIMKLDSHAEAEKFMQIVFSELYEAHCN